MRDNGGNDVIMRERSKWFLEIYSKYIELLVFFMSNSCGGY